VHLTQSIVLSIVVTKIIKVGENLTKL